MKRSRAIKFIFASVLAATLVASVLCIGACGITGCFNEPEYKYYDSAMTIERAKGYSLGSVSEGVALFENGSSYILYSLEQDRVIAESTTPFAAHSGYWTCEKNDKTAVYGKLGFVCETDSALSIVTVNSGNIIRISESAGGYKYLNVKTGEVISPASGPLSVDLAQINVITDDYIAYMTDNVVRVYDPKTIELVREINISRILPYAYVTENEYIGVLDNGDIVCQIVTVTSAESDYDYISGGKHYKIFTYLVDPLSGKVKEKNVDFVIDDIENRYDGYDTAVNSYACDNVAMIRTIKDGYMLQNESFVELGNSLKVGHDLSDPARVGSFMNARYIGDGKFYDMSERSVYKESGKLVAADATMYGTRFFSVVKGNVRYVYDAQTERCINEEGYPTSVHMFYAYGDVLVIATEEQNDFRLATYNAAKRKFTDIGLVSGFVTTELGDSGVMTIAGESGSKLIALTPESDTGYVTLFTGDADITAGYYAYTDENGEKSGAVIASTTVGGEYVHYRITPKE